MKTDRKILIKLLLFAGLIMLMLSPFTVKIAHANDALATMKVESSIGVGGFFVQDRTAPVYVKVTSSEDFVGTCELRTYNGQDAKFYNYSKPINLAAGEEKSITFYCVPSAYQIEYNIRFVNSKGEPRFDKVYDLTSKSSVNDGLERTLIVSEKSVTVYPTYNNNDLTFVMIDPSELPEDGRDLECFSFVIVDSADLTKVNEDKRQALADYAFRGGNLILTPGADYAGILYALPEGLVTGTVDGTNEVEFFGVNETSLYGEVSSEEVVAGTVTVAQLTLDDFEGCCNFQDTTILYKKAYGKGMVLVSPISYAVPYELRSSLGNELTAAFMKNRSQKSLEDTNEAYYGKPWYYLDRILDTNSNYKKPNYFLLAGILLVYVILVGPLGYLVLKKLDKRHYTWITIPAASLVFGLIIYIVGGNTRITEPVLTYYTELHIDSESALENTRFRIMAPINKSYHIVSDGDYEISSEHADANYGGDRSYDNFDVCVNDKVSGVDVEVHNPSSFETFTLSAHGEHKLNGSYDYNIRTNIDGEAEGSFTNNYDFTLKYLFGIHNGVVFYIADEVEPGRTVEFNTTDFDKIYLANYNAIYDNTLFEKIFGGDTGYDSYYDRYYNAFSYSCSYRGYSQKESSYFVGFIEDADMSTFSSECEIKNDGIIIATFDANSKPSEGYLFKYSIEDYIWDVLENEVNPSWSIYIEKPESLGIYKFDKTPASIAYLSTTNGEFEFRGYDYFDGDVWFYNYKSGMFDKVFTSGTEGIITDLTNYLQDGVLQVKYHVSQNVLDQNRYNIVYPNLSVIVEK